MRPLPILWEGLQDLREAFPTTPGPPEGPPDPSLTSQPLPAFRESLLGPPGPLKGSPDPSRNSRPLSDLRDDLPTPPKPLGGPPNTSWTSGRASPSFGLPKGPLKVLEALS